MTQCESCQQQNRPSAKYCKRCGTAIDSQTVDDLLGKLVGLPEVRIVLEDLRATAGGMRSHGQSPKVPFNTLMVGASGTAKSLIGSVIASVLYKEKVVVDQKVITIDALIPDAVTVKDIESKFNSAKNGVLFIDNAHKLFGSDGAPQPVFNRLVALMENSPLSPVVILAGLPFGLTQFLAKPDNANLTGRFQNIFQIGNYLPEQLTQIAAHWLLSESFILSAETRQKLELRFRWLHLKQREGGSGHTSLNGHLAIREASAITREYYKRNATDKRLLPEDVKGEIEKRKTIDEIMKELESFIGMSAIKAEIRDLHDEVLHARALQARGLGGQTSFAFHFTITGNPGTGKTTIARILGEIFEALGILPIGHVVELHGRDLVAEYQGQTAPKVKQACDRAMGGVLFIDEAYAMKRSEGDSFGQEAVDTLLKHMEDNQGKFVVIAAGYTREIADFLKTNPGFQSRFLKHFHLPDYSADELTAIFEVAALKLGYHVAAEAKDALRKVFADQVARKTKTFANGRDARNLLNLVLRRQSDRVRRGAASLPDATLMTLTADDIPAIGKDGESTLEAATARLNALVGLHSVKAEVENIRDTLKAKRLMQDGDLLVRHFVFTGNPGTGKTTVARIIADVFYGLGILPTKTLIEVEQSTIIKGYVGQTAIAMNELCDKALGGVLFIDEAYTLARSTASFGQEAIDTLLKRMEDDRGKFIVIVAGYRDEMRKFIDSNPGLKSRFTQYVDFEDYRPAEMQAIFNSLAKAKGMLLEDGLESDILAHFERRYASRDKNFANARDVRQFFDRSFERCASRVSRLGLDDQQTRDKLKVLSREDLNLGGGGGADALKAALEKLNALVGLDGVKQAIDGIRNTLKAKKLRGDSQALARHYVFTGNPGTGKTTVARILADVFQGMGLLPTNTIVDVDRSKIVMPYVGQTAPNMNALCDQAMGGVLFIDEAYTLAGRGQTSGDSFGQEAIEVLLKRMEDDRGKFVVIVAGYEAEMKRFIDTNSGLKSRFTNFIRFEDYTPSEMKAIFDSIARTKGLTYEEGFDQALLTALEGMYQRRGSDFGNARDVRGLFDRTFERCAGRVAHADLEEQAQVRELGILRVIDLALDARPSSSSLDEAMAKLDAMIGLKGVKTAVAKLQSTLAAKRLLGDTQPLSKHFVFTGNPGTGKTTVARILAEIFHAIELLPTKKLKEVERADLVKGFIGQTAPNVQAICDEVLGGVLFIDEAYTLSSQAAANDGMGQEAIDTLLKKMEDNRGRFVVIAAGYAAPMRRFVNSNPGLRSRFTDFIHFDDYEPAELSQIFFAMTQKMGMQYGPDFKAAVTQLMDHLYATRDETFANARTVRQMFDRTFESCAARVSSMNLSTEEKKHHMKTLLRQDLPLGGVAGAAVVSAGPLSDEVV